MPTRIPASERTSQKLDELLTQGVADGDARTDLLKLAVRKIVEEALEAEVTEAVGRGYYENGAAPSAGYRNGYRRGRLPTAEGAIEYGVPQVADRPEPFVSRVRAGLAGRTAELERLAVEMFARGLSTRDIEAAFRDATGATTLVVGIHNGACSLLRLPIAMVRSVRSRAPVAMPFQRLSPRAARGLGGERDDHDVTSRMVRASHAARCVARHGVRSHPVPVALVGECSIPVV